MPHRKKETRGTLTDADAARSSSMRTCFDSSSSKFYADPRKFNTGVACYIHLKKQNAALFITRVIIKI